MANITLNVDEEIIKKVKKIAIDKNTTMTEMIRDFLKSIAKRDDPEKKMAKKELMKSFSKYSRDLGDKSWTREELHER